MSDQSSSEFSGQPQVAAMPTKFKPNALAIVSAASAGISLGVGLLLTIGSGSPAVLLYGLLLCFGIIAIVTGHIALRQIKPRKDVNYALGVIGTVLGYVSTFTSIFIMLLIALIGLFLTGLFDFFS